ncbi:hypothetical protein BFW88_07485 [Pseudomonas fluorescens]|nr:hypothetical protein BFW88_07485 [Pseudomonas fluorescens]OPB12910.1 hypothetical protein BFW92_07460 [Pseudomonas fluorescens]OPB25309.1 hypothetical protein BFW93_07480 [Pseudomonas fluorescens]
MAETLRTFEILKASTHLNSQQTVSQRSKSFLGKTGWKGRRANLVIDYKNFGKEKIGCLHVSFLV